MAEVQLQAVVRYLRREMDPALLILSHRELLMCDIMLYIFNNKFYYRIILRRGPNGFGFVIQTIRVYFGDSDFYTMHHLVMSVNEITPG